MGSLPAGLHRSWRNLVASLDESMCRDDYMVAFTVKKQEANILLTQLPELYGCATAVNTGHFNVGDFMKLLDIEQSFERDA